MENLSSIECGIIIVNDIEMDLYIFAKECDMYIGYTWCPEYDVQPIKIPKDKYNPPVYYIQWGVVQALKDVIEGGRPTIHPK